MVWGTTATISCNSQAVGGPKILSGSVSVDSADTSGSLDLSSYMQDITAVLSVRLLTASAWTVINIIDFTTTAGTLTITHSAPGAAANLFFVITGI